MIRLLVISALFSLATIAQGEPQKHELPVGLQLRIILLNNLAYVQSDMLTAFTKTNAPQLHDLVTAQVVSAIRAKSGQSAADFATTVGISVEALQRAENDGSGLDVKALEQIWSLNLISVEEMMELRRQVVVEALTEKERVIVLGGAGKLVKDLLTVLRYTQISARGEDSVKLPAADEILNEVRKDYDVLLQLATEHFPQLGEFIALDKFNDELIASIVTSSTVIDKLRHHVGFNFFSNQIDAARQQQSADSATKK